MKIGFVGNTPFLDHIATFFHQFQHTISGIYCPGNSKTAGITDYSDVDSLIKESDILYIATNAPALYEICKKAVKEAKNMFFESPFIFDHEKFNQLFYLSYESKSIMRFSQKLLNHPVYEKIQPGLEPLLINFRLDSEKMHHSFDVVSQWLFDVSSIMRDAAKTEVKKLEYIPVPDYFDQSPCAYHFNVGLVNGSRVSILINFLSHEENFEAEVIQRSKRFLMNFTKPGLSVFEKQKEIYEPDCGPYLSDRDLIIKDFRTFVQSVGEKAVPLTINEDNQRVLALTHSMLGEMQQKVKLPT